MRIRCAVIAGTMAAVLTPVAATAEEPTEASVCPVGWFCGFDQPGYQGDWVGGAEPFICYTPMNDATSVANRTGHTIRFFSEPSCQGEHFNVITDHGVTQTPFPVASTSTGWY